MTEENTVEAKPDDQSPPVQMVPVGTIVMAVMNGQPVGCEVAWNTQTITSPDAAALALNVMERSRNDALWVVRQVMRAQPENEQKPN